MFFNLTYKNKKYKKSIITKNLIKNLILNLENKYKISESWKLLFSTKTHGRSLNLLISSIKDKFPLIFVCNHKNFIFGVFVDDKIFFSGRCMGKKNTFLFKYDTTNENKDVSKDNVSSLDKESGIDKVSSLDKVGNIERVGGIGSVDKERVDKVDSIDKESGIDRKMDNNFKIFNYKNEHPHFVYCTKDFLSFGISEGKFGLLLNKNLLMGESYFTKTFQNEKLCGENKFELENVEVWEIGF